jgi:hypothetical protein
MDVISTKYPVTIAGQKLILQFDISDSDTKKGVKMQFVMDPKQGSSDSRENDNNKAELRDKLSIVLQKKFGEAGIPIDYDERNPYNNVIGFIVPLSSLASNFVDILGGKR